MDDADKILPIDLQLSVIQPQQYLEIQLGQPFLELVQEHQQRVQIIPGLIICLDIRHLFGKSIWQVVSVLGPIDKG